MRCNLITVSFFCVLLLLMLFAGCESSAPITEDVTSSQYITPTPTASSEYSEVTPTNDITHTPTATPTVTQTVTASPTASLTPTPTEGNTDLPVTPTPNEDKIIMAKKEHRNFNTNINATISGDKAFVKTAEGLEYTASNFISYNNGKFIISNGFVVNFKKGSFNTDFNRYVICYESSAPLKATVKYTENGKAKSEIVFLEKGKEAFFCLIENYLSNRYAIDIESISFDVKGSSTAGFVLCDIEIEKYNVYTNDTYYINNGRFKVGIRLLWGGGISYISDSKNTINGLTNLVNQADEGRLIQQSYYGTGANGEYTPGTFNNAKWSYNPVQGGDKNRNHSRIIDVVVDKYSVYIKAQPQDWSLNNALTPSYMENCYTVYEDYIRVDNRFIDFSGWNHPYSHQELPAFYTVSYLNKFTWYDGSNPWQNDKLSSRSDLNFWGDSRYANDCRFYIRKSNTETWCSWTNSNVDYGIGLFVPNVDSFFAGKHAYNGSKNPADGACNYVAPINTLKMVSYEPIEYSYIMTTGSVNEIRNVFKENKDFASNSSLHKNYQSMRAPDVVLGTNEFDLIKNNVINLNALYNADVKYDSDEQAAVFCALGEDPQTVVDFSQMGSFMADDFSNITFEYMIPSSNGLSYYGYEFFLCSGIVKEPQAGISVRGEYICDGNYHSVTIPLHELSFWDGKINKIRFDFFNETLSGDVVYIRNMKLS